MQFLPQKKTQNEHFFSSLTELPSKHHKFNTTSNTFHQKTVNKLPRLNRSSSTSRSALQRVHALDLAMQELSTKIIDLRQQTKESRRFIQEMQEDLGDKEMIESHMNLMIKIKQMEKQSKTIRRNHEQKIKQLNNDCQELNQSSIKLKQLLQLINERVDEMENAMGVYSIKEKLKI